MSFRWGELLLVTDQGVSDALDQIDKALNKWATNNPSGPALEKVREQLQKVAAGFETATKRVIEEPASTVE